MKQICRVNGVDRLACPRRAANGMYMPGVTPVPKRKGRVCRTVMPGLLAACSLLAGCHKTPPVSDAEQMQGVLNSFYATHPACLWTEAVTLTRSKGAAKTITTTEGRALDYAGLIDTERHGYVLTNAGRPFWREDPTAHGAGNFCFGQWHVTRIVRTTSRPDDLFGNATDIQFEANIRSPALWTRLPQMQAAFPLMAMEVSRPVPHSATMKRSDKGWRIAVIAVPTVPQP